MSEVTQTHVLNMSLLIRPEPFTGATPFNDFIDGFEKASLVNKWTEDEKKVWIAALIQGPAASGYNDLTAEQKVDFQTLVQALRSTYEPPEKLALHKAELKSRKRKPGEQISDLLTNVKDLVRLAYPNLPPEARADIVLDSFTDALLPEDLRLSVKQSLPKTPDQAARNATTYEAIHLSEGKNIKPASWVPTSITQPATPLPKIESSAMETDAVERRSDAVLEELRKLRAEVEELKRGHRPPSTYMQNRFHRPDPDTHKGPTSRKCYFCGKPGHVQKDCRLRQGNARGRR